MYVDHGAYCLDVGRRVRRGKRCNVAFGLVAGAGLWALGTVATVEHGPPFVTALCGVAGLGLLVSSWHKVRKAPTVSPDAVLRIDVQGIQLSGESPWAYGWNEITSVRVWNAGPQIDQRMLIIGHRSDQPTTEPLLRLASLAIGWGTSSPLAGIKHAVDEFGPGRYRPGRS